MTKDKSVDDKGISTECYIQKLFNKTCTWQIIKSVTEI